MQARLAGSPAPLAALHAQASELLPGDARALHARLSALRGYPVVINKWASWCEPCRAEFGVFQRASVSLGREVAFIGIDSGDTSRAEARAFLRTFPLSYPSYYDQSGEARGRDHRLVVHARHRLLRPHRRAIHPPGSLPERRQARTRHPALRAGGVRNA